MGWWAMIPPRLRYMLPSVTIQCAYIHLAIERITTCQTKTCLSEVSMLKGHLTKTQILHVHKQLRIIKSHWLVLVLIHMLPRTRCDPQVNRLFLHSRQIQSNLKLVKQTNDHHWTNFQYSSLGSIQNNGRTR